MSNTVRTQDLFDNAGNQIDAEPVHPLERHKSKARERSKLIRSIHKDNSTFEDDLESEIRHEIEHISPSRTPVPRQNRIDSMPPLTVDTNLLMGNLDYACHSGAGAQNMHSPIHQRFGTTTSDLFPYNVVPSSPMSMSLSVGVFSCEGALPAFDDLFCTIKIGQSSSSMTESAIAVPNEDSVGVEWNQTCTCPFTSLEDTLVVSIYSSTDPRCLVTGQLVLGNVPFPYLGWFNLNQDVRILLRLAFDASLRKNGQCVDLSQSTPFSATSGSNSEYCVSPLSANTFGGDLAHEPLTPNTPYDTGSYQHILGLMQHDFAMDDIPIL